MQQLLKNHGRDTIIIAPDISVDTPLVIRDASGFIVVLLPSQFIRFVQHMKIEKIGTSTSTLIRWFISTITDQLSLHNSQTISRDTVLVAGAIPVWLSLWYLLQIYPDVTEIAKKRCMNSILLLQLIYWTITNHSNTPKLTNHQWRHCIGRTHHHSVTGLLVFAWNPLWSTEIAKNRSVNINIISWHYYNNTGHSNPP